MIFTTKKTKAKYAHENCWLPHLINEGIFDCEYSEEWKIYLIKKNRENIKYTETIKYRFTFYSPKVVASVFNLCKILNQPPDVRYLAIDILDRFLVKQFFAVAEKFQTLKNVNQSHWNSILLRMTNQLLLRILTCIQIAAKQCGTCSVITVQTIQDVMVYLKHPNFYSKRNIIKSEARICQTLNFNASTKLFFMIKNVPLAITIVFLLCFLCQISNRTPLLYIELLLEDLKDYQLFIEWHGFIYDFFMTCVNVLDIAIIHHEKIYFNSLFTNECSTSKETPFASKGDFMQFAASVVFAASVLSKVKFVFIKYLFKDRKSSWANYQQKKKVVKLGEEILNIISLI